MSRFRWVQVPVIEPINPIDVWEHTPVDFYRYGEYPRWLRPPGPRLGDHKTKWKRVEVNPS